MTPRSLAKTVVLHVLKYHLVTFSSGEHKGIRSNQLLSCLYAKMTSEVSQTIWILNRTHSITFQFKLQLPSICSYTHPKSDGHN